MFMWTVWNIFLKSFITVKIISDLSTLHVWLLIVWRFVYFRL